MYIYLITNNLDGNWYVGKRTISSKSSDFYKYYGSGVRIKKAIIEFGKENFTKQILEECLDKQMLCEREIFWIQKYIVVFGLEKSYNILLDSNYIGRNKGFKQTKEHILKRTSANKKNGAYVWDCQRRKKFSDYRKTIPIWNKGLKSDKISKSKSGYKNPMSKKVIDLDTGIIYNTIRDASVFLEIKHITLWQYVTGKRKNKTNMKLL